MALRNIGDMHKPLPVKEKHRKPVKRVRRITPERAAELLAMAKRAEEYRAQYNCESFADPTKECYDKYYPVNYNEGAI